jgi:hypothetical protein
MAVWVIFFLAVVALAAAGGGEAALVEHTFVVSASQFSPLYEVWLDKNLCSYDFLECIYR